MALTAEEQEFYNWARSAVPRFLFEKTRNEEEINAFLKVFDATREEIENLFAHTLIANATGIWLTQHALDRGTDRRASESDANLIARIQGFKDAITRATVLQAAKDAWDALGLAGSANIVMVEVRRDRAYFGEMDGYANTTDGGTFAGPDASDVMTFTSDDASFPTAFFPIAGGLPRYFGESKATFANSNTAGNDGTFTITGYSGNGFTYVNASGQAEVDAGTDVSIDLFEVVNDVEVTGYAKAYLSRGFRMGGNPPSSFIIILPFDASASEASRTYVAEYIRLRKAAGMPVIVERRTS